jgi:hypothetical protein
MSYRPDWTTYQVPGQLGLREETLFQKKGGSFSRHKIQTFGTAHSFRHPLGVGVYSL